MGSVIHRMHLLQNQLDEKNLIHLIPTSQRNIIYTYVSAIEIRPLWYKRHLASTTGFILWATMPATQTSHTFVVPTFGPLPGTRFTNLWIARCVLSW